MKKKRSFGKKRTIWQQFKHDVSKDWSSFKRTPKTLKQKWKNYQNPVIVEDEPEIGKTVEYSPNTIAPNILPPPVFPRQTTDRPIPSLLAKQLAENPPPITSPYQQIIIPNDQESRVVIINNYMGPPPAPVVKIEQKTTESWGCGFIILIVLCCCFPPLFLIVIPIMIIVAIVKLLGK